MPLKKLLWRSYLRTALIPLLVIELGFLVTYWVSATFVYDANARAVSDLSRRYFQDIAHREAGTISTRLEAVASHTKVFARQTLTALESDYIPPAEERARYAMTSDGTLYTTRDNGTTASIYSNRKNIGHAEMSKVWRLSALDPFMKATLESNKDLSSIYFNTNDSYNRIYPYLDVLDQYPHDIDIPSYNFYYKADAEHNPRRREVWTDAYVDPAGHGWMVSSIAPVWRGEKLEGVVGIDVTLETLINSLLNVDLPWGGYAILVDDKGGIIALPPRGEADFGLTEFTSHSYAEAIQSDTFKPDTFNVFLREDTRPLAAAMQRYSEGNVQLELGGPRLASFDTVPQTGWKLVIIAPTDRIFASARGLNERLQTIGFVMLGVLFAFYMLFFAFLLFRARKMSDLIAQPLSEITRLIDTMGHREALPSLGGSQVEELDVLERHLLETEQRLSAAEIESRTQSAVAREALAQLREANSEMIHFTRQMSHQIRTPLAIIDGSAQIIQRRANSLEAETLRERAERLRTAVKSIADLLAKLVNRFDALAGDMVVDRPECVDLRAQVATIAQELIPAVRLQLYDPANVPGSTQAPGPILAAIREVIEKLLRNSDQNSDITVGLEAAETEAVVTVSSTVTSSAGIAATPQNAGSDGTPSLGLSFARLAVTDCGGSLKTEMIDQMMIVTITVPLIDEVSSENA